LKKSSKKNLPTPGNAFTRHVRGKEKGKNASRKNGKNRVRRVSGPNEGRKSAQEAPYKAGNSQITSVPTAPNKKTSIGCNKSRACNRTNRPKFAPNISSQRPPRRCCRPGPPQATAGEGGRTTWGEKTRKGGLYEDFGIRTTPGVRGRKGLGRLASGGRASKGEKKDGSNS